MLRTNISKMWFGIKIKRGQEIETLNMKLRARRHKQKRISKEVAQEQLEVPNVRKTSTVAIIARYATYPKFDLCLIQVLLSLSDSLSLLSSCHHLNISEYDIL